MGKPISSKSLSVLGIATQLVPDTDTSKRNKDEYDNHYNDGRNYQEETGYENPEDYVNDDPSNGGIPMSELIGDFPAGVRGGAGADDMREFIGNGGDTSGIGMNDELRSILEESGEGCECGHHHEDEEDNDPMEVTVGWENDSECENVGGFLVVKDCYGRPLCFYDVLVGEEAPKPDKVNGYYDWLKHLIPNLVFRTGNPEMFMNENEYLSGARFVSLGSDPSNKKLTLIAFYYISVDIDEDMLKDLTELFNKYIDKTPLSHLERSKRDEELFASDEETDTMMKEFINAQIEDSDENEETADADAEGEEVASGDAAVDFDAIASDVAEKYGAEDEESAEEETSEDTSKEPAKKTSAKKTTSKSSTAKKSSTSTKKAAAKDESDDEKKDEDVIVETVRKEPAKKKK